MKIQNTKILGEQERVEGAALEIDDCDGKIQKNQYKKIKNTNYDYNDSR